MNANNMAAENNAAEMKRALGDMLAAVRSGCIGAARERCRAAGRILAAHPDYFRGEVRVPVALLADVLAFVEPRAV